MGGYSRSYNEVDNTDYDVPESILLGEVLAKVLIDKEEAISYIPRWIEEGKKFIRPEFWGDWQEEVEYFAKGYHRGGEIMHTLYILRRLEDGGDCRALNEELKNLYNDEASWMGLADTRRLILLFSKRGPEFSREGQNCYEYKNEDSKNEESKFIRKVEERNKKIGNTDQELLGVLDGGDKID